MFSLIRPARKDLGSLSSYVYYTIKYPIFLGLLTIWGTDMESAFNLRNHRHVHEATPLFRPVDEAGFTGLYGVAGAKLEATPAYDKMGGGLADE